MTPLQGFVRDHVSGPMRAEGYKRSGTTFRYLAPSGYVAVVELRRRSLGEAPVEFFVDEGIVIPAWSEFMRWVSARSKHEPLPPFEAARASVAESPLRKRLRHTSDVSDLSGDHWQLDPGRDPSHVDRFVAELLSDANRLVELCSPLRLVAEVEKELPTLIGAFPIYPLPVVLIVLLADLGRFDEARRLLPAAANWMGADDLSSWLRAGATS